MYNSSSVASKSVERHIFNADHARRWASLQTPPSGAWQFQDAAIFNDSTERIAHRIYRWGIRRSSGQNGGALSISRCITGMTVVPHFFENLNPRFGPCTVHVAHRSAYPIRNISEHLFSWPSPLTDLLFAMPNPSYIATTVTIAKK